MVNNSLQYNIWKRKEWERACGMPTMTAGSKARVSEVEESRGGDRKRVVEPVFACR